MATLHPPHRLLIGCAAGFSGDRTDAAGPVVDTLAAMGGPACLMFETLAERTLALAQLRRRQDPAGGFEPMLAAYVGPVLQRCIEHRITILGNFGAANPRGAAALLQGLARSLGLPPLRIAVVEGDDMLSALTPQRLDELVPREVPRGKLVSVNAYLGARQIAQAVEAGAQIVVTGRVADPALALGPMMAHFGWADDDWDRLAAGTMAGHLLECGAQVTGGYFADPGLKDVPGLSDVGFPIIAMQADGRFTITKARGTGGLVDARTVKEQLLYEIHDPAAYLTPDVVADISECEVVELGADLVEVSGVRGHPRPPTLKATVCFEGGWLGEGEISYAGPNAAARARLAGEIVSDRVQRLGLGHLRLRRDLIGVASVFADDAGLWWKVNPDLPQLEDVRLRVAVASDLRAEAECVVREVMSLYTCGPAGGGGVRTGVTQRLASDSCFVPREWLAPAWSFA